MSGNGTGFETESVPLQSMLLTLKDIFFFLILKNTYSFQKIKLDKKNWIGN